MAQVAVRVPMVRPFVVYRLSAMAALAVGAGLTVGLLGILGAVLRPGYPDGWSLPLQGNWLAIIFKLLAGFGGDQAGQLHRVDPLDVVLLALIGGVFLGLFLVLNRVSRLWSLLAAVSPFLGIVLFLATASAGRSGAISSVLIISIVMLWSPRFHKFVAIAGILAGILLGVGDILSDGPSQPVACIFGLGYVLVTAWFYVVGVSLLRLEEAGDAEWR